MRTRSWRDEAQEKPVQEETTPWKRQPSVSGRGSKWLKRIGVGGFLFFLIKGLIWLVIFYWLGKHV